MSLSRTNSFDVFIQTSAYNNDAYFARKEMQRDSAEETMAVIIFKDPREKVNVKCELNERSHSAFSKAIYCINNVVKLLVKIRKESL